MLECRRPPEIVRGARWVDHAPISTPAMVGRADGERSAAAFHAEVRAGIARAGKVGVEEAQALPLRQTNDQRIDRGARHRGGQHQMHQVWNIWIGRADQHELRRAGGKPLQIEALELPHDTQRFADGPVTPAKGSRQSREALVRSMVCRLQKRCLWIAHVKDRDSHGLGSAAVVARSSHLRRLHYRLTGFRRDRHTTLQLQRERSFQNVNGHWERVRMERGGLTPAQESPR